VNLDDLLRDLAKTLAEMPERCDEELRAEFMAACHRVDDDPCERERINETADEFDAEEALYSQAVAAVDRGEAEFAVPLLRRCAEAGTGEAAWLLALLFEDAGNVPDAVTWYQRACDDGDIRAAGKLAGLRARRFPAACTAAAQPAMRTERGRLYADADAADGHPPHHRLTVPGIIQGRDIGRVVDNTVVTSDFLADPGLDLRVVRRGGSDEIRAVVARLRELLRRCPAGAFGPEGSAALLASVAMVSEALIVDRDERTALRLIRAAFPHLAALGGRNPAAFEVRRAYAEAWCELGHYRRAETMLRRLSTDEERVFGSDDPRTALRLLWAQARSGQLREAEAGFRALKARLACWQGTDMLMLWHVQCRYSFLPGLLGWVSESTSSYDGVIINRSHELGYDHPDTSDARHSKGKVLVVNGYGSQAATLLQAVAEDRARVQGDSHPDTLETLKYVHLACVQAEPRDDRVLNRAITGLEHILRTQDGRHGPDYPMSQDTVAWLSKLIQLRDAIRFREPIPDLRQVPTTPGEEHGRTIDSYAISAPLGTLT
jgi:hypothetical protein